MIKTQYSRILKTGFILCCCMGYLGSFAQEKVYFKQGLVVPASHRYGREAIYTDKLAHQLYTYNLKSPAEGTEFDRNDTGKVFKWQSVKADTANRLLLPGLRRQFSFGTGAYFYLTYQSDKEQSAILNVQGNSGLYFNGEPHTGDPYRSGYLHIPVKLKKGLNELYVRGVVISAYLTFPSKQVLLANDDLTTPHIIVGRDNSSLKGAIVVINSSAKKLEGLRISATVAGKEVSEVVPPITGMSTRKVAFRFDGSNVNKKGTENAVIRLTQNGKTIDETNIELDAVEQTDKYKATFVSHIDGSVQYYAVTPQLNGTKENSALFLSVHGAAVEAISQARAYQSKDWGTLIAATNRRPRGFNWEDWGRLDALEVLNIGKNTFRPDPNQIYLTGHSMGGHGTWFLGATYPTVLYPTAVLQ
jgi:hypothetical protein